MFSILVLNGIGYLGKEKDFPEQLSSLPFKKKRNQKLSQEEKEYNKIHSRKKIIIEHTICRFKKKYSRVMMIYLEINGKNINRIWDIVIGLVNYRIMDHHY